MTARTCEERVEQNLVGRLEDLRKLWTLYLQDQEASDDEVGNLDEWGLCFDYVPGESGLEGFFRYQLSTGGPGDEFRFFADAGGQVHRVEYWFLDWFDGAHRVLADQDRALLLEIWEGYLEPSADEAIRNSRG